MAVAILSVWIVARAIAMTDAIPYVKGHVNMIVQVVVEETVLIEASHLLPMITRLLHIQVALIVQEDAKTVVPPGVVLLVMKNAKTAAKQLAKDHAQAIARAVVRLVAMTPAKQDVKTPAILVAKKPVNGIVKVLVKVLAKAVVIMLVIQLAKEPVQEAAIILACIIAAGVVGLHIN